MSLLHQDLPEEVDDAALGEDFTKGSSHRVVASVVAVVLVTLALALYFLSGQKPPVASGEIVAVWAYPHHAQSSGFDANGEAMAMESFDQVLVFAQVKLHNQCKHPLLLHQAITNTRLGDGIHSSYAASPSDYDRIFLAYPNIPVPHGQALSMIETILEPGQTIEGTFVSSFRMTKQQWDARKDLDFSFAFRYQPILVLTPHVAVIEQ
jgi:hypothetical protein